MSKVCLFSKVSKSFQTWNEFFRNRSGWDLSKKDCASHTKSLRRSKKQLKNCFVYHEGSTYSKLDRNRNFRAVFLDFLIDFFKPARNIPYQMWKVWRLSKKSNFRHFLSPPPPGWATTGCLPDEINFEVSQHWMFPYPVQITPDWLAGSIFSRGLGFCLTFSPGSWKKFEHVFLAWNGERVT